MTYLVDENIRLKAEVERLKRHADSGWHLFEHWNQRYLDCAGQRDTSWNDAIEAAEKACTDLSYEWPKYVEVIRDLKL